MDKQKTDLDKLYQERFQSFEMEPSSEAAASMLQKLKMAKTLYLVKWIVGGILIAATAVTIALLSINSDETESLPNNIENKININESKEQINITEDKLETKNSEALIENTNELHTKQESNREAPLIQDELQIESENGTPNTYEDNIETEPVRNMTETISNNSAEQEEAVGDLTQKEDVADRDINRLNKLESKNIYLEVFPVSVTIEKPNLKLNAPNRFKSEKPKTTKDKKLKISNDPLIPTQEKTASSLNGYFDLHFAPIMWQNTAKLQSPDLDNSWTYSLDHNPKLSYEFGMSFQLHHQKMPLFLQLGLDYQILKEKVDFQFSHTFEDPELSFWTYDSIWDYHQVLDTFYIIIDDNQFVIDSIFTTDTVLANVDSLYNPLTSTEKSSKDHLNTYRYINIPLLLGYQFESKNKKWSYQIMAGPAISINLKNDGFYYTKTGLFEEYSGKVSPSLVWNFYAAANINYRWKKWQFFAQPEFQYQLNESELKNQIPRRKYQFYKLKFGIRFQLF